MSIELAYLSSSFTGSIVDAGEMKSISKSPASTNKSSSTDVESWRTSNHPILCPILSIRTLSTTNGVTVPRTIDFSQSRYALQAVSIPRPLRSATTQSPRT